MTNHKSKNDDSFKKLGEAFGELVGSAENTIKDAKSTKESFDVAAEQIKTTAHNVVDRIKDTAKTAIHSVEENATMALKDVKESFTKSEKNIVGKHGK